MKGVEQLECTTVARWSMLKFIRNLVACSVIHYPGVSHRTFLFQLSRTKDMRSIRFTRPLNQIEQTKNIRIEKNRMLYIRMSSIEFGHRTLGSGTLYKKNTNGTKSFNWSSFETAKAIWSFGSFHYCISIFWVNSKYWLFPAKSVPRKNINSSTLEA